MRAKKSVAKRSSTQKLRLCEKKTRKKLFGGSRGLKKTLLLMENVSNSFTIFNNHTVLNGQLGSVLVEVKYSKF